MQLDRRVLIQELIDGEEAATDANINPVVVDTHIDLFGSELVDTLRLPHEHDLELGSFWVVIDVFGQLAIDRVVLHWNVYSNTRF